MTDCLISIRDVMTGRVLRALSGHRSQIVALAFTPDGSTIASVAGDHALRLWHTATWRSLGTLGENWMDGFICFEKHGRHLLVVPYHAAPFTVSGTEEP